MRHRKTGKILGRTAQTRQMLLRNLAASVLMYEKIKTTEAKAKAVKPLVEKLITLAKQGDLAAVKKLIAILPQPLAVKKCLEVLGKRYTDRRGGYCRIVKLGRRAGDAAPLVQLELI